MNDSRTRTILALGAAAFLALAATGCDPDVDRANATPESKSFGFSGDNLTVKSNSADLHLIASDIDDVEVERRVSGTKIGGEIAAGWQFEGGILTLSVDCDGVSVNCHAQYTVRCREMSRSRPSTATATCSCRTSAAPPSTWKDATEPCGARGSPRRL